MLAFSLAVRCVGPPWRPSLTMRPDGELAEANPRRR